MTFLNKIIKAVCLQVWNHEVARSPTTDVSKHSHFLSSRRRLNQLGYIFPRAIFYDCLCSWYETLQKQLKAVRLRDVRVLLAQATGNTKNSVQPGRRSCFAPDTVDPPCNNFTESPPAVSRARGSAAEPCLSSTHTANSLSHPFSDCSRCTHSAQWTKDKQNLIFALYCPHEIQSVTTVSLGYLI